MTRPDYIGRLHHAHDGVPFVIVSRASMQSRDLSLAARGLLGCLLSLPSRWEVHAEHLAREFTDVHESTVRKYLRELADAGYVAHRQHRTAGGTFRRAELYVRPDPAVPFPFEADEAGHDPDLDPPATGRGNPATGATSGNGDLSTSCDRSRENRDAVSPHAVDSRLEREHTGRENTPHAGAHARATAEPVLDRLRADRANRSGPEAVAAGLASAAEALEATA